MVTAAATQLPYSLSLPYPLRHKLTRLLVDLNGGHVALETDDLSDKLAVTDTNELVHGRTGHLLGRHD